MHKGFFFHLDWHFFFEEVDKEIKKYIYTCIVFFFFNLENKTTDLFKEAISTSKLNNIMI